MSREIRRVPLDYKHPVRKNPYWENALIWRLQRGKGLFTLHEQDEEFVPLLEYSLYEDIQAENKAILESFIARAGDEWEFQVAYHLTGFQGFQDSEPTVHPFFYFSDDGTEELSVEVRDEDHLQELLLKKLKADSRTRDDFMPSFADYEGELGWCLYETTSEGTPVTPVFATSEELVEHLVEHGTQSDPPLRRAAAESIVKTGYTIGTLFAVGGTLYDSTADADKL